MKFINNITSTLIALVILSQTSYSLAREDGLPDSIEYEPSNYRCGDYQINHYKNFRRPSFYYLKHKLETVWTKGKTNIDDKSYIYANWEITDDNLISKLLSLEEDAITSTLVLKSGNEIFKCFTYQEKDSIYDGIAGFDRMPEGRW